MSVCCGGAVGVCVWRAGWVVGGLARLMTAWTSRDPSLASGGLLPSSKREPLLRVFVVVLRGRRPPSPLGPVASGLCLRPSRSCRAWGPRCRRAAVLCRGLSRRGLTSTWRGSGAPAPLSRRRRPSFIPACRSSWTPCRRSEAMSCSWTTRTHPRWLSPRYGFHTCRVRVAGSASCRPPLVVAGPDCGCSGYPSVSVHECGGDRLGRPGACARDGRPARLCGPVRGPGVSAPPKPGGHRRARTVPPSHAVSVPPMLFAPHPLSVLVLVPLLAADASGTICHGHGRQCRCCCLPGPARSRTRSCLPRDWPSLGRRRCETVRPQPAVLPRDCGTPDAHRLIRPPTPYPPRTHTPAQQS